MGAGKRVKKEKEVAGCNSSGFNVEIFGGQ